MSRIIITGATGYIGKHLITALSKNNRIVSLSRRIPENHKTTLCIPFHLGDNLDPHIFQKNDTVIHLASACMNTLADTTTENRDIIGTQKLIAATRLAGIKRFIFISSQSASATGQTAYARSKWHIETQLTEANEIIVRPGLVYGAEENGFYGTLIKLIRRLPIFPDVGLKNIIQPIHITELCSAIKELIVTEHLQQREFNLGASQGISFKVFLADIAKYHLNKRIFFLRIPFKCLTWGCALTQKISFLPSVSIDRIKGLADLPPMNTEKSLTMLKQTLQPPLTHFLRESQHLIAEGQAIFQSLIKNPPPDLNEIYQNTIMALPNPWPLLPEVVLRYPTLIRFIEPFGKKPLAQRLMIATALLEAHTCAFSLFHNTDLQKKHRLYFSFAKIMLLEFLYLPTRCIAHLFS